MSERPYRNFFGKPSLGGTSSGSLVIWMLIGFFLVATGVFWIWPEIKRVELNTRLSVAEQDLAIYRAAVVSYFAQRESVTSEMESEEEIRPAPRMKSSDSLMDSPRKTTNTGKKRTLGDYLIEAGLLKDIKFPVGAGATSFLGEGGRVLPEGVGGPTILAVSTLSIEKRFNCKQPFVSSRSDKVAVLILNGLTQEEAVGLQKIIGHNSDSEMKSARGGDCFFKRAAFGNTYTGWVYLGDL